MRASAIALLVSLLSLAGAAPAAAGTTRRGYDISYPECGHGYPKHAAFGIVGVNGGLANDANPCLTKEIAWAERLPGLASPKQAPSSLYINTADPGPQAGVHDWPTSGSDSYGACHGGWSRACAYLYGELRADYSYDLVADNDPKVASGVRWWLDIESSNSWATSSTSGYKGLNVAAIKGFISGLLSSGAPRPVGVYSGAGEWQAITGLSAQATPSALGSTTPSWITGTGTLNQARAQCSSAGFTGGHPKLAQYSANSFDADLRCP